MIQLLVTLFISLQFALFQNLDNEKSYHKNYFNNGVLKEEGWKSDQKKESYWIYYYMNGTLKSKGHFRKDQKHGYWFFFSKNGDLLQEGHFINGKAEKWWIIYDIAGSNSKNKIIKKYQYQNNKKNGYCLLYKNDKLFKAEKYFNDQKMGEWTDIFSFKKDNPNVSL